MSDDRGADLTESGLSPEEREWIERVPERVDPPPALRDRVLDDLEAAGEMVRRAGRRRATPALTARVLRFAAGFLLVFLAGGLVGRWTADTGAERVAATGDPASTAVLGTPLDADALPVALVPTPAGQSHYVLLLYEGAGYSAPGRSPGDLAEEYTDWARQLADAGILVAAERLSDVGRVVPFPGPAGAGEPVPATSPLLSDDLGTIVGFFLIRAADFAEASRIARDSPHAAYGGRVVIRRIDSP